MAGTRGPLDSWDDSTTPFAVRHGVPTHGVTWCPVQLGTFNNCDAILNSYVPPRRTRPRAVGCTVCFLCAGDVRSLRCRKRPTASSMSHRGQVPAGPCSARSAPRRGRAPAAASVTSSMTSRLAGAGCEPRDDGTTTTTTTTVSA